MKNMILTLTVLLSANLYAFDFNDVDNIISEAKIIAELSECATPQALEAIIDDEIMLDNIKCQEIINKAKKEIEVEEIKMIVERELEKVELIKEFASKLEGALSYLDLIEDINFLKANDIGKDLIEKHIKINSKTKLMIEMAYEQSFSALDDLLNNL